MAVCSGLDVSYSLHCDPENKQPHVCGNFNIKSKVRWESSKQTSRGKKQTFDIKGQCDEFNSSDRQRNSRRNCFARGSQSIWVRGRARRLWQSCARMGEKKAFRPHPGRVRPVTSPKR